MAKRLLMAVRKAYTLRSHEPCCQCSLPAVSCSDSMKFNDTQIFEWNSFSFTVLIIWWQRVRESQWLLCMGCDRRTWSSGDISVVAMMRSWPRKYNSAIFINKAVNNPRGAASLHSSFCGILITVFSCETSQRPATCAAWALNSVSGRVEWRKDMALVGKITHLFMKLQGNIIMISYWFIMFFRLVFAMVMQACFIFCNLMVMNRDNLVTNRGDMKRNITYRCITSFSTS